jgi:hypothetical protein
MSKRRPIEIKNYIYFYPYWFCSYYRKCSPWGYCCPTYAWAWRSWWYSLYWKPTRASRSNLTFQSWALEVKIPWRPVSVSKWKAWPNG